MKMHPPTTPKGKKPEAGRPDSSLGGLIAGLKAEAAIPEQSRSPRMASPSNESALNQLQIAGRSSPQDDRSLGFSKMKGGARAIPSTSTGDRRYFPKDMRGVLEIYEQGCELQKGMKSHCKDTTDALQDLKGHCDDFVKGLISGMEDILLEIRQQVEKPANVDWTPVLGALAKVDCIHPEAIGVEMVKRLEEHQYAMYALESRIEKKMDSRIDRLESSADERDQRHHQEFDALRGDMKNAQQLSLSVQEAVRHTEGELLETLGNQHRALKADVSQTLQDILRLQEKKRREDNELVEAELETQLRRILGEHHQTLTVSVADQVEDVSKTQRQQMKKLGDIEPFIRSELERQFEHTRSVDEVPRFQIQEMHKIVNDDMALLFDEVVLIAKALNVDYVRHPHRREVAHAGVRCRDYGVQACCGFKDSQSQTDEGYFKHLRKKEEAKAKKLLSMASEVAEKPAFEKKKSGFGAHEAKKKKMREALVKPAYNVALYYHEDGCAQGVARSQVFENFTFMVILSNAGWIAIDTDHNNALVLLDANVMFQVIENIFCFYFSAELLIRFLAFKRKRNCSKDAWFVFDFLLVFGMILETWVISVLLLATSSGKAGEYAAGVGNFSILRVARLVKILRMARMARLLRMIPELIMIVKSIGVALRSVAFFLLLTVLILYVFAVGFRQITKDSPIGEQYFSTVPKAMNSLLLEGMLPLFAPIVRDVSAANPLYWPIIMVFVLLASITVMNMLIGVLVEVVRMVAERERESMSVIHVTNELREVMLHFISQKAEADTESRRAAHRNANSKSMRFSQAAMKMMIDRREKDPVPLGTIPNMTKETFEEFLSSPTVVSFLRDVGVDALSILDSVDIIFEEKVLDIEQGLSFVDFVDVVLNMRGTNPATVKDVKEQMRLLRNASDAANVYTNKMFHDQLSKLRMEFLTKLNEIKKSMDSDSGSDDNALGSFALAGGSRVTSSKRKEASSMSLVESMTSTMGLVDETSDHSDHSDHGAYDSEHIRASSSLE